MACPLNFLGDNWDKFLEGKVKELRKNCYCQSELKLMLETQDLNTALNNWKGKKNLSWGACVSVKLRTDYSFCLYPSPLEGRKDLID